MDEQKSQVPPAPTPPVAPAPAGKGHGDWYAHPEYIGKTKGRVGGGCCSWGCAVSAFALAGLGILVKIVVVVFLALH